jgi:hypothetical protein
MAVGYSVEKLRPGRCICTELDLKIGYGVSAAKLARLLLLISARR